jgi:hypothetical protein
VAEEPQQEGLRERVGARGEELVGRVAQDLLENPMVNSMLAAALDARGRAAQAQEIAMEFMNLPSAAQIERLTRRVRSVAQRLESIEDTLSRVEESLRAAPSPARLDAVERRLDRLLALVEELRDEAPAGADVVSRDQERLRVDEG